MEHRSSPAYVDVTRNASAAPVARQGAPAGLRGASGRNEYRRPLAGWRLLAVGVLSFALAACGGDPTPAPAETPVSVTAKLQPTFTATAEVGAVADAASAPATVDLPAPEATNPASAATPADPAALLPTATPAPAPLAPDEALVDGRRLHRYGDYANARVLFNRVVEDPASPTAARLEALYDLGRAYLAEELYGEALATFDRLDQALQKEGADPDQFGQKEHFLRAEALMRMGRYSDAVAAYWRFLETYPWMAEAVQPRIARAYLATGDTESASVAFRRAIDAAGDRLTKVQLLEDVAQTSLDGQRFADAVAAYDEILALAENAGYRAQIQYQAGQALAAAGDTPGAVARWQAATAEMPETRSAYLALIELVNRNVDFDLYQRGYIDLMAEAYVPAINAFQAYLDSVDATDVRAGNAVHGLGQAYLGAGNFGDALATLNRVIADYPACDCVGQAWLDKAAAEAGLGDPAGARRTYRTFARDYPDHPLAPEALWQSGLRALGDGNQVEAAVDFLALADAFPASERAPQALYLLGLGAYRNRFFDQAAEVLDRLRSSYPDYRWDAASYWLGRSLAATGATDAARTQWQSVVARAPDIYYGVLSAYALQDEPMINAAMLTRMASIAGPPSRLAGDDGSQEFAEQWLADWLEIPVAGIDELPAEIAEDQNLAKGRLLLELDQRGDALTALERVYERNKDTPRALYSLSLEYARLGAYRLSILSMVRLLEFSPAGLAENAPVYFQRYAYPRPFDDLIVREARANGLDPLLYFSLIRQESLFEEGARSTAAAQGLAQIIPDTGLWIAGQLGHPEYTNDIIYRPVINLRFGAYYLGWARDFLDGNLLSALVGYNAGPGNAKAWRELAGPDDTLFVEILAYSEPRLYVRLILGNLYHYTRLNG
ncbi:MAG: tetratricopeptide repeat protein [Caldilineaceae bacterium]|nr:tetratricopeptide repeat protein [Caldilineaceae bacterium]